MSCCGAAATRGTPCTGRTPHPTLPAVNENIRNVSNRLRDQSVCRISYQSKFSEARVGHSKRSSGSTVFLVWVTVYVPEHSRSCRGVRSTKQSVSHPRHSMQSPEALQRLEVCTKTSMFVRHKYQVHVQTKQKVFLCHICASRVACDA